MYLTNHEILSRLDFLEPSIRVRYTNFINKYQDKLSSKLTLDEVVERVKKDEPIEYIFNLAEFYDSEFYVDQRCLIPRPETEELVKKVVDFFDEKKLINNENKNFSIIDVGTGSGCIILTLAKFLGAELYLSKRRFYGIDVSSRAIEVARINFRKHFDPSKILPIFFFKTSFEQFSFDNFENLIICTNLPYIPNDEELQKSVRNYEPHLALFGGKNGDELNKKLLQKVLPLPNVKAVFMEGYGGKIESYIK